jgi:hypothetical protein
LNPSDVESTGRSGNSFLKSSLGHPLFSHSLGYLYFSSWY